MSLRHAAFSTSILLVTFALLALWAPAVLAHQAKPHKQVPVDAPELKNVQTFPSEGRDHIKIGGKWKYRHYPPTSGPHDPVSTKPGFYNTAQAPEKLVHSLEHGIVVIYYDKPEAVVLQQLKNWAKQYDGLFDGVIVTSLPGLGKGVILTAWTKLLRLDPYDPKQASLFIMTFRGKGPESP